MDKIGHEALLFDFYGQLLTDKQIVILDMYLNNDFSLGETAEELGISRQGVHDTVKRSVKALEDYEERLGLVKRFMGQQEILLNIKSYIVDLKSDFECKEKTENTLNEINILLDKLI